MGIVTLDREISHATTLQEALNILLYSGINPSGTIRVIAGGTTGFLTISNGFVRGAIIATTGEKGLAALNELLSVHPGMFNFSTRQEDSMGLASQGLQIHIESLVASVQTSVPTNVKTEIRVPVPKGQKKEQPSGPLHRSLTPEQLQLLEVYRKLNGPADRMAFLKENPGFVKFFEADASTLTDAQRVELDKASLGASEEDVLSFLEFHRKVLGDAQEVSEAQIQMLRDLYRELQTEEKRRSFLSQNELMDEDLALSRGGELWLKEEEERKKALDAIREPEVVLKDSAALIAIDGDYRVHEKEQFHTASVRQRRRRGDGDMVLAQGPQFWWLRPEVMGICVTISLVGVIMFLVYSFVMQSVYVSAAKPEEDMVTMDLIVDEALGVEIPRSINNAQISLLVEGGISQGGGGEVTTADPRYWREQTEIAKRFLLQGKVKEAKALLSNVIQQDPYDVSARQALVEALLSAGQRKEARALAISGLAYARAKEDRKVMEGLFFRTIGDKPRAGDKPKSGDKPKAGVK